MIKNLIKFVYSCCKSPSVESSGSWMFMYWTSMLTRGDRLFSEVLRNSFISATMSWKSGRSLGLTDQQRSIKVYLKFTKHCNCNTLKLKTKSDEGPLLSSNMLVVHRHGKVVRYYKIILISKKNWNYSKSCYITKILTAD